MDNIYNYFNLSKDFKLEDLNKAYKYKIEILKNIDLNYLDKKILINQYNKMYRVAKNILYKQNSLYIDKPLSISRHLSLLDNFFNFNKVNRLQDKSEKNIIFTNNNTYLYKEKLLPNGERLVKEIKGYYDNDNKNIERTIYKILKNGEKVILDTKSIL